MALCLLIIESPVNQPSVAVEELDSRVSGDSAISIKNTRFSVSLVTNLARGHTSAPAAKSRGIQNSGGNNRHIIFVDDEGYQLYLQKLGDACKKYNCDLKTNSYTQLKKIQ